MRFSPSSTTHSPEQICSVYFQKKKNWSTRLSHSLVCASVQVVLCVGVIEFQAASAHRNSSQGPRAADAAEHMDWLEFSAAEASSCCANHEGVLGILGPAKTLRGENRRPNNFEGLRRS